MGEADLVAAGVTTPYDHRAGLTPFDRLMGWAFDGAGRNLHDFDADHAREIVEMIDRLAAAAGHTRERS